MPATSRPVRGRLEPGMHAAPTASNCRSRAQARHNSNCWDVDRGRTPVAAVAAGGWDGAGSDPLPPQESSAAAMQIGRARRTTAYRPMPYAPCGTLQSRILLGRRTVRCYGGTKWDAVPFWSRCARGARRRWRASRGLPIGGFSLARARARQDVRHAVVAFRAGVLVEQAAERRSADRRRPTARPRCRDRRP